MPEEIPSIKIRVRSGESEAEIEAALANIKQAIDLIPEVLSKLPQMRTETAAPAAVFSRAESLSPHRLEIPPGTSSTPATSTSAPVVTIEKGDSLSDVISKFFSDPWGRSPRKLMEVRDALQSYGLNYPKQSVAVALLRLAKASKIRRFKGESGEYVYTASTGAVRIPPAPASQSPVPQQPPEEPVPAMEAHGEQQQQQDELDLNAPSAN